MYFSIYFPADFFCSFKVGITVISTPNSRRILLCILLFLLNWLYILAGEFTIHSLAYLGVPVSITF